MCEYCRNTSGLKDRLGGCVSCGAMLPKETSLPLPSPYTYGGGIERVATWNGSYWSALGISDDNDIYVGGAFIGRS